MSRKRATSLDTLPDRWYRGADVPMREIHKFARRVAECFKPDKIILFGSYAYGTPHADSDVDILVIMPCRNEIDQRFKIRLSVEAPFPMNMIVRTPDNVAWRLEEGESFHTEVVRRGTVLYEKRDSRVGSKGRGRPRGSHKSRRKRVIA